MRLGASTCTEWVGMRPLRGEKGFAVSDEMRFDRRIVLGIGAALLGLVLAGQAPAKQIAPRPQFGDDIQAGMGLTGVSGWMAIDLDTGAVIDEGKAALPFAPASVAKLPTAAFALDALGPEHRFETRILAGGPVRDGRVRGDLILQGGGDPELDTDALPPLVAALKARGITGATGALLADGTLLPQVSEITTAQEVDAAYNPSVSGLNLNFNRVHVKWDARKGRERLSVEAAAARLSPAVEIVRVALAPAPGAPLFAFHEEGGSEHWQMAREAYRGQAARWLPVKRPDLYAGEVFRTLAAQQGIALEPARSGRAPAGAEMLAAHRSRPLADILREMLRHSTNLTAEVTGAAAARGIGADAESLAQSAAVMNAWAASVAGFPLGDPEFRLVNHSGLTLESRVSPRRMVALLAALGRRAPASAARPAGSAGLPGGIAGYLRAHDVSAEGVPIDFRRLEVVAKTGTMSYVRGLAGYVATPGGRRLAFAIFSNDLDRRGDGPERVDKAWMGRAKGFERALIRSWVLRVDGGA
jgi:serine-type D-Ala-D-Ala carboxypeptidase/endopeptidase (penicillin-binding protein 4)